MDKFIKIYNEFSYLFVFLSPIIVWVITKLINIKKITTRYRLRKILKLKKTKSEITLSFFDANVWTLKRNGNILSLYTPEETQILIKIVNLLHKSGYDSSINLCSLKSKNYIVKDHKNRFVCGGPYTNPDTYQIFRKYFFPWLKFSCSKEWYNKAQKEKNFQFLDFVSPIEENPNSSIRKVFYGKQRQQIEFDINMESLIFLIRLIDDEDFNDKNHGTVHVIFGISTQANLFAINCLLYKDKPLFQLVKKYTNHYAYAFKVSLNGEINFSEPYDLTEALFNG